MSIMDRAGRKNGHGAEESGSVSSTLSDPVISLACLPQLLKLRNEDTFLTWRRVINTITTSTRWHQLPFINSDLISGRKASAIQNRKEMSGEVLFES